MVAVQTRKNAEREKQVRLQRRAERAIKSLGPINLTAKEPDYPKRKFIRGKSPKRPGFVYVIRVQDVFKIGLTENFKQRIEGLKAQYKFRQYKLIVLIEVPNMLAIETELHRAFSPKHIVREWFKLDQSDIATIHHLAEIL